MSKFKKIFLLVLLVIYAFAVYLLKDNQRILIMVTVTLAIIGSVFVTLNNIKKK